MNPFSSRQACAAVKVVGCIVAIPLIIVTVWIPYTSILFTVAFNICILRAHRSELFSNSFEDTLAGLITGFMLPVCAVLYHFFISITYKGELIGVMAANMVSICFGGAISIVIVLFISLVKILFYHFMKECSDNKKSDVSATNDPGSRKTDTDGMAT